MKKVDGLNSEDKKMLIEVLEEANPKTVTTIKDLRTIDKLCSVLECDGDVSFEDADFEFLKTRLQNFTLWVPKARQQILRVAEALGL